MAICHSTNRREINSPSEWLTRLTCTGLPRYGCLYGSSEQWAWAGTPVLPSLRSGQQYPTDHLCTTSYSLTVGHCCLPHCLDMGRVGGLITDSQLKDNLKHHVDPYGNL